MRMREFCLFLVALLSSAWVHAEEQVVSVPGEGWRIRFDAPAMSPVEGSKGSIFSGRADRLQLSFFVEPPRCPGGDSDESIYECFAKALRENPIVEWDTERGNTVPNGVLVMYMAKMESDGLVGRSFNMHLLFARRGKWADIHASMASPTKDDISMLYELVSSVKIEDEG